MDCDDLKLASADKRSLAFFIDELIIVILVLIIYYEPFLSVVAKEDTMAFFTLTSTVSLPFIIIRFIYHTFFIYRYGATIGKFILKIKVVNYDNNVPNFSASLIRSTIRIFSETLFYLGFVWAFFDTLKQTWHDKLAKTLVVSVD